LVDDDYYVRRALTRALRAGAIEVEDFDDGREAAERFHDRAFTCAILDLCMPGWDGVQTALALRAFRPDLPLIVWTGGAPAVLQARAHALGLAAFFEKPCDLRSVVAAVRRVG